MMLKVKYPLRLLQILMAILTIFLFSYLFRNEGMQNIDWTFPYCSGAANFKTLFDWRISPAEYDKVATMSNNEHRDYRYQATDTTILNNVNEYGYVLVAFVARHFFYSFGDIQGLVFLQILVHAMLSLFVMGYLLKTSFQRISFFILYGINPLVLHIVTFPFYYFWTVLPSVSLAIIWLKPKQIYNWLPIITMFVLFSLMIRPTTLFLCLFIFGIAYFKAQNKSDYRIVIASFLCFLFGLAFIFNHNGQRSFFHTAYIGIGAYPNIYGIEKLDDTEGYKYYYRMTGTKISSHPIHGNWKEKVIMKEYNQTLKQRYIEILSYSPLLLIKNAALNTIQAFGVGYDNDRPWARPITILIGVIALILLIITKQWICITSILLYAFSFTLYFPPIPAYLFGAYLLSIIGMTMAMEKIYQKWNKIDQK